MILTPFSENFLAATTKMWNDFIALLPSLLVGIGVLALFIVLGLSSRYFLRRRLKRRYKDPVVTNFYGDIVKWVLFTIGAIASLHVMGFGGIVTSLMAGAGISALIVGFAFKDIAENFLAGFLLAINRPFHAGDLVEIEGNKGTVKSMDLRTTHLRVADGRDIYVPNSIIMKGVLTNYTRDGLLRIDFVVGVAAESDMSFVADLILDIIRNHPDVLDTPPPAVNMDELATNSVNLRVLFWMDMFKQKEIPPEKQGSTLKSRVMTDVREALVKNGIAMPANVLEHKMYDTTAPLEVRMNGPKPA